MVLDAIVGAPYNLGLRLPVLKLRTPKVSLPSSTAVFFVIVFGYFLVTAGIIYDIIVEPPSIGQTVDDNGHVRPVAFLQYRINGQYIMEGLSAAFMFVIGASGFIVLDKASRGQMPQLNRKFMLGFGFLCTVVSYAALRMFIRMKLPGYMIVE